MADLRRYVCEQNVRLRDERLVSLTWGNVSGRSGDQIGIKPSGVPYSQLTPTDIVVLDLDGHVIEGDLHPSVDTATHLEIYRAFPNVRGVVHAHSIYATAFAQARVPIQCLGTTHADHFSGPIPVTRQLHEDEVATHYERNTGRIIVEQLHRNGADPLAVPAILAAGHAPFVWGHNATAAVDNTVALEASAHMAMLSLLIKGGPVDMLEEWIVSKHHERKHGQGAYYGQQ